MKLAGIRELWEKGELTDLVLRAKCDGTSNEPPIKVHRIVAAACSPTLKAMLCNDMRESVEDSITLQDIAPTALDELVRFMYTDSLLIGWTMKALLWITISKRNRLYIWSFVFVVECKSL